MIGIKALISSKKLSKTKVLEQLSLQRVLMMTEESMSPHIIKQSLFIAMIRFLKSETRITDLGATESRTANRQGRKRAPRACLMKPLLLRITEYTDDTLRLSKHSIDLGPPRPNAGQG